MTADATYPVIGIDVSEFQGVMDWPKAVSRGIAFAFIRGGIGASGQDAQFSRNRAECERLEIPYGVYHVFKPSKDWKKQAALAAELASDATLPMAFDIELTDGVEKTALTGAIGKYVAKADEIAGQPGIIYTSASFWNTNLYRNDWAKDHDLWTAHYTSAAAPLVPDDWGKIHQPKPWTFWQHSAGGNRRGAEFGAQSADIDLNRFNGTLADFNKKFKVEAHPVDPGTQPVVYPYAAKVIQNLNLRNMPEIAPGTDIGNVLNGKQVNVLEAHSDFVRIEAWISGKYIRKI